MTSAGPMVLQASLPLRSLSCERPPDHSLPRKERGLFESGPGTLGAIM